MIPAHIAREESMDNWLFNQTPDVKDFIALIVSKIEKAIAGGELFIEITQDSKEYFDEAEHYFDAYDYNVELRYVYNEHEDKYSPTMIISWA